MFAGDVKVTFAGVSGLGRREKWQVSVKWWKRAGIHLREQRVHKETQCDIGGELRDQNFKRPIACVGHILPALIGVQP